MSNLIQISPGTIFGYLTFIREAKRKILPSGLSVRVARCECSCGKIKNVLYLHLVRGRTLSCGSSGCRPKTRESVVGLKFGGLTILRELPDIIKGIRFFRIVEASCICGTIKSYRLTNIKKQQSCGCIRNPAITHGLTHHPLHSTWGNMINRCGNKKVDSYPSYGGKGIRVCKEWRNSFKAFYDWAIENGWECGLQIDRFPNRNGNYKPTNCRWATPIQNANNKDSNVVVCYKGVVATFPELGRLFSFDHKRAYRRWKEFNYSVVDAIEKPTQSIKFKK